MTNISISGKLPAGDGNGLTAIMSELVREDPEIFVTIALIDCKKVVFDKDTSERVPTARIRRIEVVLNPEDKAVCRRLLERALDKRTGREQLPYDLQTELDAVFGEKDIADYQDDDSGTA